MSIIKISPGIDNLNETLKSESKRLNQSIEFLKKAKKDIERAYEGTKSFPFSIEKTIKRVERQAEVLNKLAKCMIESTDELMQVGETFNKQVEQHSLGWSKEDIKPLTFSQIVSLLQNGNYKAIINYFLSGKAEATAILNGGIGVSWLLSFLGLVPNSSGLLKTQSQEYYTIVDFVNENDSGFSYWNNYNMYSEFSRDRDWDWVVVVGNNLVDLDYYTGQYGKNLIKDSLRTVLAELCETESTVEDGLKVYEISDSVLSEIKSGKKLVDALSSDNFKKSNFYKNTFLGNKEAFEAFDKASSALDWSLFSAEQIEYLLTDYSKNVQYIDSFKDALVESGYNDADVSVAINELKIEYTQKYFGVVNNLGEKIAEEGLEKGVTASLDFFTGGVFSIAKWAKNSAFDATGLSEKAKNIEMLTGIESYKYALNSAYEAKAETIRSGVYTEEDLQSCERLFELCKATTQKEYELMYELCDDSQMCDEIQNELGKIKNTTY